MLFLFLINDSFCATHDVKSKRRAIVFVFDYVSLDEVLKVQPKVIMHLINSGGIAALCLRTGGAFNPTNACMTVACGDRVAISSDGEIALNIFEPIESSDAMSAYERCTGRKVDPSQVSIVMPYVEGIKRGIMLTSGRAAPFALGESIRGAGMKTAVIGCDDIGLEHDQMSLFRHAALIASPSDGTIPFGDVSKRMLKLNPNTPFGVSVNMEAFSDVLRDCLSNANLLVFDIGETYRAALYAAKMSEEIAMAAKAEALHKCDRALELILKLFDERSDLLIIFTTTTSGKVKNELGFIIAYGHGITDGSLLTSETTRRHGLVTLTDIAPTILHHLGIDPAFHMVGRRMRCIKSTNTVERVKKLIELTTQSDQWLRAAALYFMGSLQTLQAMLVLLWAVSVYSEEVKAPILARTCNGIGVFVMALPISYWCEVLLRRYLPMPSLALIGVWLIALIISTTLWSAARDELRYIGLLSIVSVVIMLLDAFTGSNLQLASIMGYSPYYGGRFYGLGNVGMPALLGCALSLACTLESALIHARLKAFAWLLISALTTVAIGHPNVGANFGGLLSTVPAFAAGYIAARGIKFNLRRISLILITLACALVVFVTLDLLRGAERTSHIGRFVILIHEGSFAPLASMLKVKALTWWRAFKHVPLTIALCSYAICGSICALLLRRKPIRVTVANETLRAFVASSIVGALTLLLINDSGPLTPVIMLSYGWSAIWLITIRATDVMRK